MTRSLRRQVPTWQNLFFFYRSGLAEPACSPSNRFLRPTRPYRHGLGQRHQLSETSPRHYKHSERYKLLALCLSFYFVVTDLFLLKKSATPPRAVALRPAKASFCGQE